MPEHSDGRRVCVQNGISYAMNLAPFLAALGNLMTYKLEFAMEIA